MRTTLFRRPLCLCFSLLMAASCSADVLDVWHWRNPPPQANDLRAAIYGQGLFLLVGDAGALVTSPDAVTWANQEPGTNRSLFAAASGNGSFVVVGTNGII